MAKRGDNATIDDRFVDVGKVDSTVDDNDDCVDSIWNQGRDSSPFYCSDELRSSHWL